MTKQTGDIYYEWAHKHCHPETCSCRENYRIVEFPYTIDWAETEQDAKELVKNMLRRRDILKVLLLSLLAPFRIGSEEVVHPKGDLISNKSVGFTRGKVYFQLTLKEVKHNG